MKDYQQALDWVHGLPPFSKRPGLERVRRLLDLLGNPQERLRFIHVAGTNGKGSVTTMCSSILREAGYRTGLYISPFVIDFRERFQIDGEMISKAEFTRLCQEVREGYETLRAQGILMNEYDVITALSLLYFHNHRCDIVCFEVGLGGLYDATNIIPPPEAAVIMKISYDHTAVLGDTLTAIAGEKAGIIKRGSVCVCYPDQEEEALAVIMEQCAQQGVPLILPNQSGIELKQEGLEGSSFCYDGQEYELALPGHHQVLNAVTAIETIRQLRDFQVSGEQLRRGLAKTTFPARMELLSQHPLLLLDGAHNANGVQALMQAVKKIEASPKIAVAGMLADKDYGAELALLSGAVDQLILTQVQSARAESLSRLQDAAQGHGYPVSVCEDLREAYELALKMAGADGLVVIFGSLFLASDLRRIILGKGKDC